MTHNDMVIWATVIVVLFLAIILFSIFKNKNKKYRKYWDFRYCIRCGRDTIHTIYENVIQGDGSLKSWNKCERCEEKKKRIKVNE